MDIKLFLAGVGFLLVAYFIYRTIKNSKVASEETNWEGTPPNTYIGLWGGLIMCIMCGIAFILKSL